MLEYYSRQWRFYQKCVSRFWLLMNNSSWMGLRKLLKYHGHDGWKMSHRIYVVNNAWTNDFFSLQTSFFWYRHFIHFCLLHLKRWRQTICNYIHLGSCLCYMFRNRTTPFLKKTESEKKKTFFFDWSSFIGMERRNENDSFFIVWYVAVGIYLWVYQSIFVILVRFCICVCVRNVIRPHNFLSVTNFQLAFLGQDFF